MELGFRGFKCWVPRTKQAPQSNPGDLNRQAAWPLRYEALDSCNGAAIGGVAAGRLGARARPFASRRELVAVKFSHDRARLSIGRPAQLVLTHDCPAGASIDGSPPAQWHHFKVAFSNGEYTADFSFDTWISGLVSFHDQLVSLNRDLTGSANWDTVEHEMDLRGEIDKLGHVKWTGELRYPGGIWKARLEFWFEDDQTSLSDVIRQVRALIAEAGDESKFSIED